MQEGLSTEVTLILIGSTIIILMLTGLIVASLFINQKRKFRHVNEKLEMKNNFHKELLQSQLEIQSQSFETISRELHDNVGTLISIAMVHVKSVSETAMNKDTEKLTEATGLLNEAMDTLRDISKSINPKNINQLGWQQSLLNELERIRKTKLFIVHYNTTGDPFSIDIAKQVILFRILQETLNNIVKHSGGENIYIDIKFDNRQVTIIIEDDGKGFDARAMRSSSTGAGIKNMQARADMLPATFQIESAVNGGTSITIVYKEESIKPNENDKDSHR